MGPTNPRYGLIGLAASVLALNTIAFAAPNLRSSFPGRRVGGGTRGECTARIVAHLVPVSNVFGMATSGELALVQGPTANPVELTTRFKPQGGGAAVTRTIPASSAGFILIRGRSITAPTVWETSFDCASGGATQTDPLAFVATVSPPAVSLLLPQQETADAATQVALTSLSQRCGSTVPTASTLARFGLADLVTPQWPETLPVQCL